MFASAFFWQQNLHYHSRVRALPNSRLDNLEVIDGFWGSSPSHQVEALSDNWRSDVRRFTDTHGQHILYDELDISIIIEREQTRRDENFCLTQTIAACNCTGLCTKMITQLTSTLTIYPRKGLCVAPKATVMQSFDFDRAID